MFHRIKSFIEYSIIAQTRYFFQRVFRGYSDDEVWDLDNAILRFTLPRLKALRATTHSFPGEFYDDKCNDLGASGGAKWDAILDKMIRAMELKLRDDYWYVDSPNRESETAEVAEGLALFGLYFEALWD